jgi:hypothetical protein
MLSGTEIVVACPHCGAFARLLAMVPEESYGAKVWTDGKMEGPLVPEHPSVVICSGCADFYWSEEAQRVGEIPNAGEGAVDEDGEVKPEWLDAPRVGEPSEADYLGIVADDSRQLSGDDEISLRLLAWWRGNDTFRKADIEPENKRQADAIANMEHLLEMLDPSVPDERIFRAELLRQLGRFDEVGPALEGLEELRYQNSVERIRTLAKQQTSRLDLISTY